MSWTVATQSSVLSDSEQASDLCARSTKELATPLLLDRL